MIEKIERLTLNDGGHSRFVDCVIRKSARAKRISLRVASSNRAILTLPKRTPLSAGFSFLSAEREWLSEKTSHYPLIPSLSDYFLQGGDVWLDYNSRKLSWEQGVDSSNSSYVVGAENISICPPRQTNLEEALLEACRSLAKSSLASRLDILGRRNDLKWSKLRVGNQRSRWGSCSERGTISLNWRLILLPFELGDYVICHELAHLRYLNHSASFWQFLEQLVKGSRTLDKRLKVEGKCVMGLAQKY